MQEWEELLARAEGGDRIAQVQLADCYAQGRAWSAARYRLRRG